MKQRLNFTKKILLFLCVLKSYGTLAQQQLASNQNYWFLTNENCAAIAEDTKLNFQSLYRRNWLQFDNSPELNFCRIETSNSSHAWDLKVQQYSNSFYRQQDLKLGWRYSLKLDENQRLNFGLRLGLLRSTYAWSNLHAQNPEELPEIYLQNNWTTPVADMGLLYSISGFRFSFHTANLNLISPIAMSSGIRELPSFSILSCYKFKLSKLSFSPVLQLRSVLGLPITYDFSILMEKEKKIGFQCGYKNQSIIYANMRFLAGSQLAFSFSYDYPIALQKITGPGTELAIVFYTK